MYNTYISTCSSIVSLRTTYFTFNDYSCYYPYEKCPSNCCFCSCCCSFPVSSSRLTLPMNINLSLLYGLRQSTLIQNPPSRGLVIRSNDGYCYRSSIYGVGSSNCCGELTEFCGVKKGGSCKERLCVEKRKSGGVGRVLGRSVGDVVDKISDSVRRREHDFRCNALDDADKTRVNFRRRERDFRCNALDDADKTRVNFRRRERDFRCNSLDDAEAILSLLSDEESKECVLLRDRKKSVSKNARVVKEENVVTKNCKDVKDNVFSGSGYLEIKSKKQRVESSRDRFREGRHKRREEGESRLTEKDSRSRRRESSSSYYSLSELGGFESDIVNNVEQGSRTTGGIVISEVNIDVLEYYNDEKDQQLKSIRRDDVRAESSVEWDWRKKSEKKLTDESSRINRPRKESILRQSELSQVNESSSIIASSSKKQFNNMEEVSSVDTSSRRQARSSTKKDSSWSEHMKSSGRNEQSITDLRFREHSKSHIKTGNQVSEHLVSGSLRDQLTSGASSSVILKSQILTDNESSHYLKSSQQHEQSSHTDRQNVETISTTGCELCTTCGRILQESKIESDIEQRAELSETHSDGRWSVHKQYENRYDKLETGTSSSQILIEEKSSELLDNECSYGQSSLRKETQPETPIKNLVDISTLVKLPHDVKKLPEGPSDGIIKERLFKTGKSSSHGRSTSEENKHHSVSDKRIIDEQNYSTSKLKSVKESVEKQKLVDETFVQTRLRTEVQEPVLQVGLTADFSGEVNTSQPTIGSIYQTGAQQVSDVEVKSDLNIISLDSEPESTFVRRNRSGKPKVDSGSGFPQSQTTRSSFFDKTSQSGIKFVQESFLEDEFSSIEPLQESSTQIDDEFEENMRHDTLTSETRIENEISLAEPSYIPGGSRTEGLLDDMWDAKDHSVEEVSESESLEDEISESIVTKRTGKSLSNVVSGLFRLQLGSSSETQKSPVKASLQSSSNDSGGVEAWFSGNEHDDSTENSMKIEEITLSEEPTSSDQPLIMRIPTMSRQEDKKKKELITMSQEPTSELPLLRKKETVGQKKDRKLKEPRNMSEELTLDQSLNPKTTNRTQRQDFKLMSSDDQLGPVEVDDTSSASASQGDPVSGSVSIVAHLDFNMTQQTSVSSTVSPFVTSIGQLRRSDALKEIGEFEKIEHATSTCEQSEFSPENVLVPSTRQLLRSDTFEETEEGGEIEDIISSTSDMKSFDVMESGVTISEETHNEVNRRKLKRSKQVMSDRFDEWEDAFRRENEQRKIDELFMREALTEAIKAADSWEVPVGAVLVQNGKIVARGYNLVEELRDSTAHAEMICIRDASKVLQTWRLSETTLYVTLEPCPMCAGAILQARIGTLVWGAPNKLLGADGSWIRLFPDGVEGEERSEVADKPAAPVHPFHTKMIIRRGILGSECAQIMQKFFQLRRKNQKEKEKNSEEKGQPSHLPISHNPAKLLHKIHDVFHIT